MTSDSESRDPPGHMNSAVLDQHLAAMETYTRARRALLEALGCATSNRDPLAEFSERLVAALVEGSLPPSRVQKGWDVLAPDSRRIQVRYLANPDGTWVNGHVIDFAGDCDQYALVIIEALEPRAVLVFSRGTIADVCAALGKRHPRQHEHLQLTQRNYQDLIADPKRWASFEVEVHRLSHVAPTDIGSIH